MEKLTREYYLRTCDFDCHKRIMPSAVLDLFQDAAGAHSVKLGCGYADLAARDMMWVLCKVRYRVLKQPKLFDRVTVETWPLPATRLIFEREYIIRDECGEPLIIGSSEWVVVHAVRRKFMPAAGLYNIEEFCEDRNFPEKAGRLRDFECELEREITPGFSQTDMNGHVNNTKYANFVLDVAEPTAEDEIESLRLEYKQEVLAGQTLSVGCARDGKTLRARGADSEGKVSFLCEIEYK